MQQQIREELYYSICSFVSLKEIIVFHQTEPKRCRVSYLEIELPFECTKNCNPHLNYRLGTL